VRPILSQPLSSLGAGRAGCRICPSRSGCVEVACGRSPHKFASGLEASCAFEVRAHIPRFYRNCQYHNMAICSPVITLIDHFRPLHGRFRSPVPAHRGASANCLIQRALFKAVRADSSAKSIFRPVFPRLTGAGKDRQCVLRSGNLDYRPALAGCDRAPAAAVASSLRRRGFAFPAIFPAAAQHQPRSLAGCRFLLSLPFSLPRPRLPI
jgi:hypothetical protein